MSNPWREASTLIIVTRASIAQKVGPDLAQNLMMTSRVVQSSDNQAINASRNLCKTDYRVLMVKRSNLSSFMASAYVFPGGQVEVADYSPKWYKVFEKAGISRDKLDKEMKQRITGPRASILQEPFIIKDNFKEEDFLLPEIGLRIAAIRETFEETGKFDLVLNRRPEARSEKQEAEGIRHEARDEFDFDVNYDSDVCGWL